MKKVVINKCMNYIKKYNKYSDVKLKEIEYGLTGIYLTLSKIVIIIFISLYLNIFKEVIIFMVIFNIIRTTAFGLHATKSWICLISSILIFILLPYLCIHISINMYLKIIIGIISTILIYKNAPADTYKRPIVNKKRRYILKYISTLIVIIYFVSALYIKNEFISNCLIMSMILENCLISEYVYKIFKLPYNNYVLYLKNHPEIESV